jgi:hypothetical protein
VGRSFDASSRIILKAGDGVFVSVDGQDLSLVQFARMFASYTGWSLRVEVVPTMSFTADRVAG